MTTGRYYATVMPIWAVLYVIGLLVFDSSAFAIIGALVFAVLALVPNVMIRAGVGPFVGRDRGAPRVRDRHRTGR